jgi:hypothetical protein
MRKYFVLMIIIVSGFTAFPVYSSGNADQDFVVRLVRLITSPDVFKVRPETVANYFKDIVTLSSEEKDSKEWIFGGSGAEKSSLRKVKARFQAADPKSKEKWLLLVISFELIPKKGISFEKISKDISAKLKPPVDEIKFGESIRRSWQISKQHGLTLEGQRKSGVEELITIEIAVFQGEAD